MNISRFIERTATAGFYARSHDLSEILQAHSHQAFGERVSKALYAKLIEAVTPSSIRHNDQNHKLLGGGGQQTVYASQAEIIKIILGSITRDRHKAESVTEKYSDNFFTVAGYMSEHLTPTDFEVRKFRAGLFASIAIQPRIQAVHEFVDVNDMISYRDDEAYMAQIQSLLDSLTSLYIHTGLQMDLNGPRNILLHEIDSAPRLEIVDTLVVTPELQSVVDPIEGISTKETIERKMSILRDAVAVRPVAVGL